MAVGGRARGPVATLAMLAILAGAAASSRRAQAQPASPAQPAPTTSAVLRDGNAAAVAGDWPRVAQLVDSLLRRALPPADLAEAHRLAGLAAFFQQRTADAETHFLSYLRIDLDGRLDPALYPPDVVAYFNDVASRHAAELRALRSLHVRPRRSWVYNLVPPAGQFQNGERTKGYVVAGLLGTFLVANLTTYYFLRSWCDHTEGVGGGGLTCSDGPAGHDRTATAERLRPYNIASGIGFLITYAYGVYDGVHGYRKQSRDALQPFVTGGADSRVFGITGTF